MNYKTCLLLLSFIVFANITIQAQTTAMSFNIRYNNPNDGDNWWENRKTEVVQLLDFYHPDFVGIQEGLIEQLKFIDENLNSHKYIGVGRDDGKEKGEFTAIFYNTNNFELIETKTFWLSKTPDKISVGWDASMERISTYGIFKNKKNGDLIHIFNCHFDHLGETARKESAKLILKKIKEFKIEKQKIIVMGDLNCTPDEKPIKILNKKLQDAFSSSEKAHYGPIGTFNSFDCNAVSEKRIDYIFVKNIKPKYCSHIDDKRKNNLCVSDHYPVFIEF